MRWADCVGWLEPGEAEKLAELARGRIVVELGAYKGRSTLAMADTAAMIHTYDMFDGRGDCGGGDTLAEFRRNTAGRQNVAAVIAAHETCLDSTPPGSVDLVFIDGSHDEASVYRDAMNARRVLRFGGVAAFHDAGMESVKAGMTRAGFVQDGRVGNLAWGYFA